LENCHQLKTVQDAQGIRRRVMDNLEKACLPGTEEAERKRLLSFVVCGGGPTGGELRTDRSHPSFLLTRLVLPPVEFASELFDMVNEDVLDCKPLPCSMDYKIIADLDSQQTCPRFFATRSRYTLSSPAITSSTPTPRPFPTTPRFALMSLDSQ
jgi:hypothetical protein